MTKQEAIEKGWEKCPETASNVFNYYEDGFNAGARWALEQIMNCNTCEWQYNTCSDLDCPHQCGWQIKEELLK